MGSIISSCMNVVRNLPLTSALDFQWHLLETHELTNASITYPTIDLTDEKKILQTAARFFMMMMLPSIAVPIGIANVGIGATHFVWCICNINKIRNRESGYPAEEMEKALTRVAIGLYDVAIGYLICSSLMISILETINVASSVTTYGKWTFPLVFALRPFYLMQLHNLVFEKATKPQSEEDKKADKKPEIDHHALKVGCLIKQFCHGLILTFLPKPELKLGIGGRILAVPSALVTFVSGNVARAWNSRQAAVQQPPTK